MSPRHPVALERYGEVGLFAQIFRGQSGLTVAGVASARRETAAHIQDLGRDVVLLDMAAQESHAIVRVKQLAPGVPTVALGVPELERDVLACAEAGIAGYITREGSQDDPLAVVDRAAHGELQCSPEIAASLLRRLGALAANSAPSALEARLTIREREVVRLVCRDLSNKEIANRLGFEVSTVKNHVHNLLEKLNVHGRIEAVRLFDHSRVNPALPIRSPYADRP